MKTSLLTSIAGAAVLWGAFEAHAQTQVYSEDFEVDNSANWILNQGLGANTADFSFDYSAAGIPAAPHSAGGNTRGLKLQANVDPTTQAGSVAGYGLSVSPLDFSITENFEMRFDMWLNYLKSANGSTQVGGAGFGTAGAAAQLAGRADSIFIGATGDGGSAADYRVYSPAFQAGLQDASGVYAAGSRNNTATYYVTNFPGGAVPPEAQTNAYPAQTGLLTPAGTLGFKWRDVALKKVANIITYRIDGVLIATIDANTNGTMGGANILFNLYDINGNASTDPLATNLQFALFDNVRITNFPSVVSVTATVPDASEAGPIPGTFTITRTEPGPALTVYYTMSGTATSGADYVAPPGSVNFAAGATTATVTLTPINDNLSEFAETVMLSINESTNYFGAGNAIVTIADNDTPTIDISTVRNTMYERLSADRVTFRLTRRGDLNAAGFNVNLSYGGTASPARHTATSPVYFETGLLTQDFDVTPVDDALLQGDQTIQCSVTSGAGYAVGTNSPSATATIVDDELPAETVVFSDDFNTDSSANWTVNYASTNSVDSDYVATFSFDYATYPYVSIPPAPHSGTDTHGVFLQVNKYDGEPVAAAVNLYPKGKTFTGNYALRFDMFLVVPSSALTEYALFGINHSGAKTNWFRNSAGGVPAGWSFDGLFCGVETDAAALGDYAFYSAPTTTGNAPTSLVSRNASTLTGVFKKPPFGYAGAPSNVSSTTTPSWADVEVSQVGSLVTMKINQTTILTYTNTTAFTSGNIMLGLCDAYDSIGGGDGAVVFDNVRVVQLAASSKPRITSISINGGTVEIAFTAEASDTVASFGLQEANAVNSSFGDVSATITGSGGNFKAVRPVGGVQQFYRIKRN